MVWIEAPMHNNYYNNAEREAFNRALNNAVKYHDNTKVLQLKKVWNTEDTNLYIQESSRYTSVGLNTYWQAVDCTVRYADTILFKKLQFKPKHFTKREHESNAFKKNDKYHWTNKKNNYDQMDNGRRLPEPPRRR